MDEQAQSQISMRCVAYEWRLRQLTESLDMSSDDVSTALAMRGISIDRDEAMRLINHKPDAVPLNVVAALCDILSCNVNDLIQVGARAIAVGSAISSRQRNSSSRDGGVTEVSPPTLLMRQALRKIAATSPDVIERSELQELIREVRGKWGEKWKQSFRADIRASPDALEWAISELEMLGKCVSTPLSAKAVTDDGVALVDSYRRDREPPPKAPHYRLGRPPSYRG